MPEDQLALFEENDFLKELIALEPEDGVFCRPSIEKADTGEGRWVTINGRHVYIDSEGGTHYGADAGRAAVKDKGGGQSIASFEHEYRGASVEHMAAYSSKGIVLGAIHGSEKNKVVISDTLANAAKADGNTVITHNHPDAVSFSVFDVVAASGLNLKEMRAVTRFQGVDYNFVLGRPDKGWPTEDQIKSEWEKIQDSVLRGLKMMILGGKLTPEREKSLDFAATHQMCKEIAKKFGMKYSMTHG